MGSFPMGCQMVVRLFELAELDDQVETIFGARMAVYSLLGWQFG